MNSKFEVLCDNELMKIDGGDAVIFAILTIAIAGYGLIKESIRDQGYADGLKEE